MVEEVKSLMGMDFLLVLTRLTRGTALHRTKQRKRFQFRLFLMRDSHVVSWLSCITCSIFPHFRFINTGSGENRGTE